MKTIGLIGGMSFVNAATTSEIYTLSLNDALPSLHSPPYERGSKYR